MYIISNVTLRRFELNVWKLDVLRIPKLVWRVSRTCYLQVKIQRLCFDKLENQKEFETWHACVTEDSVVMDYKRFGTPRR